MDGLFTGVDCLGTFECDCGSSIRQGRPPVVCLRRRAVQVCAKQGGRKKSQDKGIYKDLSQG